MIMNALAIMGALAAIALGLALLRSAYRRRKVFTSGLRIDVLPTALLSIFVAVLGAQVMVVLGLFLTALRPCYSGSPAYIAGFTAPTYLIACVIDSLLAAVIAFLALSARGPLWRTGDLRIRIGVGLLYALPIQMLLGAFFWGPWVVRHTALLLTIPAGAVAASLLLGSHLWRLRGSSGFRGLRVVLALIVAYPIVLVPTALASVSLASFR